MPRIAILSVFALGVLFSIGLQTQALDTFEAETIEKEVVESNLVETIALEASGNLSELSSEDKAIDNEDQEEQTATTDPVNVAVVETEDSQRSRGGGSSSSRPSSDNDDEPEVGDQTPEAEPIPVEEPTENPGIPGNPADLNKDGLVNDIDLNMLQKIPYGDCLEKKALGQESCLGDVNLDGKIDFDDLTALLAAWYDPKPANPADLNRDSIVGHQDLNMLLKLWLTCTPIPEEFGGSTQDEKMGICWGDLDGNGIVDFDDITSMLSVWTEEK